MICLPADLTLATFFAEIYKPKRLKGCSPRSVEEYHSLLRSTKRYLGRDWLVTDLTDETVESYLDWLLEKKRSKATANKHLACLKALATLATKRKIRERIGRHNSPPDGLDVDRMKAPKRVAESWRLAELEAILSQTYHVPGEICGSNAGVWWRAFILFCYFTGYRIDTIVRMPAKSYNPKEGSISVPGELMKDGDDDIKRLPPQLVGLMNQLQVHASGYLFAWPYECQRSPIDERRRSRAVAKTIRNHFRKMKAAAGVSTRKYLFHKLRATHATELKNAGGDPTASLGHSHESTTRAYLAPANLTAPSAAELLTQPQLKRPDFKITG